MEAVEHADCVVIGGAHEDEIGFQTASQGELIALIPKVEEPVIAKEMEEPIVKQEVEQEVVKHVEAMLVAKEEVNVMEDKEDNSSTMLRSLASQWRTLNMTRTPARSHTRISLWSLLHLNFGNKYWPRCFK